MSTNVPAAARRQINAANRMISELNAKPGQTPAPMSAADDTPPSPAVAPPPGTIGEVQLVPPPAVTAAQPAPAAAQPAEDFQAKYNSLKGKYNKEIAQANAVAAEERRRADAQQAILERLLTQNAQPAAAAAPPAPAKPEDQFKALGVTDKELADYGPEFFDLVKRVSNGAVAATQQDLNRVTQELNRLKGNVEAIVPAVVKTSQQAVFDELFRQIGPQWVAINNDDEFLAWLDGVDVFSGTSRMNGLQNAFKNNDATRVVAIFKAYVDGKTPTGSTARTPQVDAATLVAPGAARGGAGEAPGATDGRIWAEQEITDFYQRVRKGKVPVDVAATTEAEIVRALTEGRVRPARSEIHSNHM